MTTTALLIEILLSGALAACWVLLGVRLMFEGKLEQAANILSGSGGLGGLVTAVGVIGIYLLGWLSHFMSEVILDRFFQSRHRDQIFSRGPVPFYRVRTLVFERASEASVADLQFDRQVLRITRAAALNLMLIAVLVPMQPGIDPWVSVGLSSTLLGLAGLALAYWRQRYQSTFRKFLDIYSLLEPSETSSPGREKQEVAVQVTGSASAISVRPLVRAILGAADQGANRDVVPFVFEPTRNQLLFFLKPEALSEGADQTRERVVTLIMDRVARAGIRLNGAAVLTGAWLRQQRVMDRHYGSINRLSREASGMLSKEDRAAVLGQLEVGPSGSSIPILGAHEFLERHPSLNGRTLNELWESKKSVKIRGGFYVQRYDLGGEAFILVNGFHPQQLAHYTDDSRRLLVALCSAESDWRELRDEVVGDTFPERAVKGSIRGMLWAERAELRPSLVSVAFNYVHLSAGPLEALHEIRNFLGNGLVPDFSIESTVVGRLLAAAGYPTEGIDRLLANPLLPSGRDLFGSTENLNSEDVVGFLREARI